MDNFLDKLAKTANGRHFRTEHKSLSWAEQWVLVQRSAGWVGAHGGRVACVLANTHESVATAVGAVLCGGVAASLPLPHRGQDILEYVAGLQKTMVENNIEHLVVDTQIKSLLDGAGVACVSYDEVCAWGGGSKESDGGLFVQYTSGSTGAPKGIPLTGEQMWAQMQAMRLAHGLPDDFVAPERSWDFVSWLPMAHDMGFVGQLLLAWSGGVNMMLRDPQAFLVNPLVWLQDLHDEKAMCSSSPNFALDLVMRKLERSPDHNWDLSNLARIWCGGEAPNPATLRRFTDMTARYGLGGNVLAPAYGMAEVGACVSLAPHASRWKVAHVELEALSQGRVVALDYLLDGHTAGVAPEGYVEIVSNGTPLPGYKVSVNDDCVLEVDGPSLYSGYLGKTERVGAHITGDLGVLVCGEVVVIGRADDVIVVRGRNIHPQDVEEACSSFVRAGCVAAVTDGEGGIAVIAEPQGEDLDEAASSIRKAVAANCGIGPSAVLFVARGSLAKTSSGKTKRRGISKDFASNALNVVSAHHFR